MEIEGSVAQHYAHGRLERAILDAVAASGKDLARLAPVDLAPVDEFHIGGRRATVAFAAGLAPAPGTRLLDVGCGIGGASRYFALEHACHVTGIDLTDEYVAVARALASLLGLADRVEYRQGSALAMPFADASFGGAYLLHVGMNIADKPRLFAEVRRVLARGARFGIYDVMRDAAPGELRFPVPWATAEATSFVESPTSYRSHLEAAGFLVEDVISRREFAAQFFRDLRASGGVAPPLGMHLLMGESAGQKVANMIDNLERGLIAPVEIFARVQ